jgi:hypothetical protein
VAVDNILTGNSQPREPSEGIEIVAPGAAGEAAVRPPVSLPQNKGVGRGISPGPQPQTGLTLVQQYTPSQASPADAAPGPGPGPGPQRKRVSTSPNQVTAPPNCTGCSLVANKGLIRLEFDALARSFSFPKQ